MDDEIDPAKALRQLYWDLDGFEIPRAEAREIHRTRGSSTYGELMPTATLRLLAQLELGPEDRFVDLGSGTGKVVLLAAMSTAVGEALGVELSVTRSELAEQALIRAKERSLPGVERARLVTADMLTCDLDATTVVYTCSTAFREPFMHRLGHRLAALPRLRKIASLQDFEQLPGFELAEIYRLDASWKRRTKIHVYEKF